ncbi:MAG: hypothetical protein WCR86_11505 [Parabacteroides sp.]
MSYTMTQIPNGEEVQRRLEMVSYLESLVTEPVGVQLDTTANTPSLQRIDINGENLNVSTSFFDKHVLYGGMTVCARTRTTGTISYGEDNAGTGLVLDGSTGRDVLVEYPLDRAFTKMDGDFYQWYVMPINTGATRYVVHPCAVQRGGTEHSKIYIGAKEAYFYLDGETGKLGSASGKQPVTGAVSYTDLPSGSLTLDEAETYANNIGAGFGICNAWTYADIKLRMLIEYATFDIPTKLGLGVTNLAVGDTGTYGGVLTGADSIDSNIGTNGTGSGTGVNGETPICWRGLENIYGNVFEYMAGLNMFLGSGTDGEGHAYSAGEFRVLCADGTGEPAATLAYNDYLVGSWPVPVTVDNYISTLQPNLTGLKLFMPQTLDGTNTTGVCDTFYHPRYDPSVVAHGGYWANGTNTGPYCMYAGCPTTYSHRMVGCRIEYYPTA